MVEKSKSLESKKKLLAGLIGNYQFSNRPSKYILNYILRSDSILRDLRFVSSDNQFTSGHDDQVQEVFVEMSVLNQVLESGNTADGRDFYYRDCRLATMQADQAFVNFKALLKTGRVILNLKLNIPPGDLNIQLYDLLEDSDHNVGNLSEDIVSAASEVIEKMTVQYELDCMMARVNEALDRGDRKAFMEYSEEYREFFKKVNGTI